MRTLLTNLGMAAVYVICSAGSLAAPETAGPSAAPSVTVMVDGRAETVTSPAGTVGGVLEGLEIALAPLDRTLPALDSAVTDGMAIWVTRVECCEEITEEVVAPRTITLADPDGQAGHVQVLSEGRDGLVRRVHRVWTKNSEETHRSLVSEEVLEEVRHTIVLRGTRGLDEADGDWRQPLVMEATAYEPGPRSCGKWANGYTAIGLKAEKGVVAVDDRVIPMRTRLYIPGYGFAIAADRGAAIKGDRIDLCFATYAEAIQFGRRPVNVYILN